MPLNPSTLASLIEAQMSSIPIAVLPASTVITPIPKPDGTLEVQVVPAPAPVFIDPSLAKAIAQSVAKAVVAHLLAEAVVTGGGTLGPGKIT